jgi:hypothetical protein
MGPHEWTVFWIVVGAQMLNQPLVVIGVLIVLAVVLSLIAIRGDSDAAIRRRRERIDEKIRRARGTPPPSEDDESDRVA